MVDAIATVALGTLRDLLIEEARFYSNAGDHVEEVGRQLQSIHAFLKDADKRRDHYNSETMRDWVAKLRDLSIEAENVLERYAIQVRSKREGQNLKDKLKRFTCILSECMSMHTIGNELEDIRSRMSELTKQAVSLNNGIISSSSANSVNDDTPEWSSRRTYGHEVERYFVGMEAEIKLLESLLIKSDDKSNQVISICGMGGLGKTTLANKIYQMESVRRSFEARAWICISQQFKRKTVLQEVLNQLSSNEGEQSEDELVRKLYKVQKDKRCLVVLDDIWEIDHWNSLKCAFPIGEEFCKVLLTSRNERIAETEYVHKLKCLSEDEGWELLQKIALHVHYSHEVFTIDQLKVLEDIGREIVRKCGCLPLPISVIGGILRQDRTQSEWKKVRKNIDSYLQWGKGVEENKSIKHILDLSYNVLPYNLKPCFLYLGCFPEDRDISTIDLYLLWMGEGMISCEDKRRRETLRDVAQRYLSELVDRCMVQVEIDEESMYNRFRTCRLHDLMRDLCLSKGKEEGFLEILDANEMGRHDASSVSRLAISTNVTAEHYELHQFRNLRSLLFMKKDMGARVWSKVSINFGMFKYLKILKLEGYKFQNGQLPKGIEKLILLKHLSIARSYVDELPVSVCKLPCLESLDLYVHGSIRLPVLLGKMNRLKYLVLPCGDRSVLGGGKLKLDSLNELETIMGFNSSIDDIVDLTKLSKLRVFYGDIFDEGSLAKIVNHILTHQDQFRETKIDIQNECNMMNSEIDGDSTLIRKTLLCHSLSYLEVECHLNKLPSYEDPMGRNLLHLGFVDCYISEDPMETLEKLPVLRSLQFAQKSFVGREMICGANGFPQLRELTLSGLPNLEQWKVEEKTMPNLSKLSIYRCRKLQMIPNGLKFITTLKQLKIRGMPKEITDRVRAVDGQEGQDYHKIKHIPTVDIETDILLV